MSATTRADPNLCAAVLAGGMSRRMGVDKALLPLRPGDPPLARVVVDRVRRVAGEVFVVANERPGYEAFGVPVVPDRYPDGATLGGVATALEVAAADVCLVVACDMPFLNVDLLRWMADQPRDYDVLVPRVPGESRQGSGFIYQTLHAIYRKSCLPAIQWHLSAGRRQVIGFFPDVTVREVDDDQLQRLDSEGWSFFNANTPEAANVAREHLTSLDRP